MARKSQSADDASLSEEIGAQPTNAQGQPVTPPEDEPRCALCGQPEDKTPDLKAEDRMDSGQGALLHPRCRQEYARRQQEKAPPPPAPTTSGYASSR